MIQHKELKKKQNTMKQMHKSTQEGKKEKTYWNKGSFGMLERSMHSPRLAYTMNIAQRQMDSKGLLNGLIRIIQSSKMRQQEEILKRKCIRELDALKQGGDPPFVILKKAERIVNSYFTPLKSNACGIFKVFFDYYGIDVKQGDRDTTRASMQEHQSYNGYPADLITEEHIDEVFAHDQSDLLGELNSLYGTATGGELLERIRSRDRSSLKAEIRLGFSLSGAHADFLGDEHEGELKDPDGKKPGRGVGTSIFLNSMEQLPYLQEEDEDPRIVLAHELIHALHANLGVKPTSDTVIGKKIDTFMGSVFLDSWMDKEMGVVEHQQFYNRMSIDDLLRSEESFRRARPDDIPVTGIMNDDIIFPESLEAIKHINENRIRVELGLPLRRAY